VSRSWRALLLDVLQTAFRLVPWPTAPGVRTIGRPDETSPVLITGNYDLTVRRVMRDVRGVDAWLVVAPSRGINVWCAAAGGHLSTHDVVRALKTSGIEQRVRHRHAILPQLAATGVHGTDVANRCGWSVRFGPVYARDIPAFLAAGQKKSDAMRQVAFAASERWEMAAAWASPASVLVGAGAWLLRPAWTMPLLALIWGIAVAVFFFYDRIASAPRLVIGSSASVLSAVAVGIAGGGVAAILAAPVASLLLTGILAFDVEGSTPTAPPSLFESSRWHIVLDRERCVGAYRCWEVCPEACFEKRPDEHKIALTHADRCIRCGACVVQCPVDALYLEDDAGERIAPDVIRRFKMNMLGKRAVRA
jgi:NAD-dependent dihydropyrimidine dehydrogenase PreA subunit